MTERLVLTTRQLQCLRGKWDRKLDKVIAAELGISLRAVEEHLRSAREKLGVTSSVEAAQTAAALYGWADTVPPNRGATELSPAPVSPSYPVSDNDGTTEPADANRSIDPQDDVPARPRFRWPLRKQGEQKNDLGTLTRLSWILCLAIGLPAAAVLVLAVSDYLGRFVNDIWRLRH